MKILVFVGVVMCLSACGATLYEPVRVEVPTLVPCPAHEVEPPVWPMDQLAKEASVFEAVKAALMELELRRAYEERLKAARCL